MAADSRIAGRYAKSLLDLARERGQLDAVTADVRHFQESAQNRDLQLLLASPIVSTAKKQGVLEALFGKTYQELTRAFLRIVTDKRREAALPAIADEYLRQYKEQQGISTVRLTSAAPLGDAAVEAIKAKLRAEGLTTDKVELERAVDPELIGGFVLEVGDRYYDASARSQLRTLRKEFTGNPYQKNLR